MKITIIQPATIWEDKNANFSNIEQLISACDQKTELVVLPEMFSTGFSLNAGILAEEEDGQTYHWMKGLSKDGGYALSGSYITKSANNYYNHFKLVTPEDECFTYKKRHLFSLAGEHKIFSSGNKRIIFQLNGFRFLPLVCYDLRFPVWSRNRNDYDVIICVASWPDVRREAWNCLLKARAIENQCYVIGVNRTGTDNEGFNYAGDSVVLDPAGKILIKVKDYEQGSATAEISLLDLQNFRERFPVWKDADDFTLKF